MEDSCLAGSRFGQGAKTRIFNSGYNNHSVQLWTYEMMIQRLNYMHNNPGEAGFVCEPRQWKYSSAHDYCGGTQGLIDLVVLM